MPELFKILGFSISFNSQDIHHRVHVHVGKGRKRDLAKFILTAGGDAVLEHNKGGLGERDLLKIRQLLVDNHDLIVEEWDRMFESHHFDA